MDKKDLTAEEELSLEEEGSLDGYEDEIDELEDEYIEEDEDDEEETDDDFFADEQNSLDGDSAEIAEEKEKSREFKLTPPQNLDEIFSEICTKRARKLLYKPADALINITATVMGTDKSNEEGIKVKDILEQEIKDGVKLGYLDKFDGLKTGEMKEEYENDVIYEFADQEFKRTGLILSGETVKVYVYDWDLQACHHVGYIEGEEVEKLKPYLADRDKYSFDVCGIITGGKFKKIIKDESGKVKIEKGNDGKLGVELDVTVINRKD